LSLKRDKKLANVKVRKILTVTHLEKAHSDIDTVIDVEEKEYIIIEHILRTGFPRYMWGIETREIGSNTYNSFIRIMNSHTERPIIITNQYVDMFRKKRLFLNRMYAKWQIRRLDVTRAARAEYFCKLQL